MTTDGPAIGDTTNDDARHDAVHPGLPEEPLGGWFWLAFAIGAAIIAYGIWGAFGQEADAQPLRLLRFGFGSLLAHDAVIAPVVTVGGIALAHFLPTWLRGPVRGGLAISGIVVLFSWPLLRGYGRHELNDSILPLDYGRNIVIVLGVIWATAAVMAVVRFRQSRSPALGRQSRSPALGRQSRSPALGEGSQR